MNKLICLCCLLMVNELIAQPAVNDIRLNQLGFYPLAKKIAILVGDSKPGSFYILPLTGRDTAFRGRLGNLMQSTNSSLKTRVADFSAFKKPGKYKIYIPATGYSYEFVINHRVNSAAATSSVKGFYFQRVSMPLEKAYAGKWSRPAGHPDTVVLVHPSAASPQRPAGTKISSPAGWYDAGDYNKYIVNSGITMGTLFSAYQDFTSYFDTLHLNLPESKDRIPDILNECLYNLRWMLTMQDPNDGGVYHKCTNAAFDGMVMPGVTKLPRYVVQKSTTAALDFAAVMSQASRIFQVYNRQLPGLADSCLNAATAAFAWAEKNPSVLYDQNGNNNKYEPKITTGAYGDRDVKDEWYWAAAELFVTTKSPVYADILTKMPTDTMQVPSWANVRMLGIYSLLRAEKTLPATYSQMFRALKGKLLSFADAHVEAVSQNAFQTVMGRSRRDFVWGSCAVAANQGILLVNAYLISGDKKYLDNALSNLDYIMGRNATGYCFVTGLGTKSPLRPHHRPSVADGIPEPVPGLLSGGPNPGRQDSCNYVFTEPETAFVDDDCSYASNEIAINWNAPLVYLANAIEALQFKAGYSNNR